MKTVGHDSSERVCLKVSEVGPDGQLVWAIWTFERVENVRGDRARMDRGYGSGAVGYQQAWLDPPGGWCRGACQRAKSLKLTLQQQLR